MSRELPSMSNPSGRIQNVQSPAEFEQALAIRYQVFVVEQGVPVDEEKDELDAKAQHYLAFLAERAVGTARLVRYNDTTAKVGRVALLDSTRGSGLGKLLMRHLERAAREQGFRSIVLDAQIQVIGFYEKLGYVAEGPEFLDAGIVHRRMTLWLS